jgi:hypothetical protein
VTEHEKRQSKPTTALPATTNPGASPSSSPGAPSNDRRPNHARNQRLQHLEPRNPNRQRRAPPLGTSHLLRSSVFHILARTLYYIPWFSPLHPGRILTTFVGVDFLIELMVANGAAKAVNTSAGVAERLAGQILIKTALILQACTFRAYVAIMAVWHTRARGKGLMTGNLRRVVAVMYTSAPLISVRCIYRIVEYFEGWMGWIVSEVVTFQYLLPGLRLTAYSSRRRNTHEAYFYVFEALLVLANSVMLNAMHPGPLLPRDSRVYLAPDGFTELKGPGWRDPRRW